MNYAYPTYLCHHGVRGMKWGQRKQKQVSSGPRRGRLKEINKYESRRYDYYSKKYGQGKNNQYSDSIHDKARKSAQRDARSQFANYDRAQKIGVAKDVAKVGAVYASIYGTYKISKVMSKAMINAGKRMISG